MYTAVWVNALSYGCGFSLLLEAIHTPLFHIGYYSGLLFWYYLSLSSSEGLLQGTSYVPDLSFVFGGAFFLFFGLQVSYYLHHCHCHLSIGWVSPWPWMIWVSYGWRYLYLPWQGYWWKDLYILMVCVPSIFLGIFLLSPCHTHFMQCHSMYWFWVHFPQT